MLMGISWTAFAITGLTISASAGAETAGDAVRIFGLPGTWSLDCAQDLVKGQGYRHTYSVPTIGDPIYVLTNGMFGMMIETTYDITSAARVTEDKIKLKYVGVKAIATTNETSVPRPVADTQFDSVIEKAGNKIKLINLQSTDGKTVVTTDGHDKAGNPTPPFEKCLN